MANSHYIQEAHKDKQIEIDCFAVLSSPYGLQHGRAQRREFEDLIKIDNELDFSFFLHQNSTNHSKDDVKWLI